MLLRELSIVRGWPAARATVGRWRARRFRVLLPWLAVSLLIALVLLALVWFVGSHSPADPTRPPRLPGDGVRDPIAHLLAFVRNNGIVLALHAAACMAGYIVHVAVTDPSVGGSARLRRLTRGTASIAVLFVPAATLLSIGTQAWVLGSFLSTAADHLELGVAALLATTLPHAVVELTAVFLPLAASIVMLARGQAQHLFAATLVSVAVAVPLLFAAAWVETYAWPERVRALRAERPSAEGQLVGTLVVDAPDPASPRLRLTIGQRVLRGEVYATPQQAARAAAGPSSAGSAIAVVATPRGHVLHRVFAEYGPGPCDDSRGRAFERRPFELSMLRDARLLPDDADAERDRRVRVVGFVDGADQRSIEQLREPWASRGGPGSCADGAGG